VVVLDRDLIEVTAHEAALTVAARPEGGLRVDVRFPARIDTADTARAAG
jgi:hypothetical protein